MIWIDFIINLLMISIFIERCHIKELYYIEFSSSGRMNGLFWV